MERTTSSGKRAKGPRWSIGRRLRFAIYARDGFRCAYCGTHLEEMDGVRNHLTLDHLVCRSAGGAVRDPRNLVTACNLCNATRGCKALEDFATGGARERIAKLVAKEINLAALDAANLDGQLGGDR